VTDRADDEATQSREPVRVGGPFFEDFAIGQVFDDAPAMTLTSGHAALHQALVGDRMRLPLDAVLSTSVTGRPETLAHPSLVCDVAIGQSTGATQRVRGNLFYRGLVLLRPVYIGDTLRTMIPLRSADSQTGHTDRFEDIPTELDMARVAGAVVSDWRFDLIRDQVPGVHFADVDAGRVYEIEGRDTVTAAPELVRLSLNMAETHVDAGSNAHGRRLVYGGHTISVAAAQLTRALPNVVTIVAWRECNHTGPVFEGDILNTVLTVEAKHRLPDADAGLLDLRAVVQADRGESDGRHTVLDWRLVAVMA